MTRTNGDGTSGGGRTRVLIVDDHPTVREALAYAIEDQLDLHVCGSSASAAEAKDQVATQAPDVAVVDLMLQDGYGLDLIPDLLAFKPTLGIVVFSMYDEDVYAERVLRAGARGYLMKNVATSEVIHAIRDVASGRVYLSRRMSARLLGNLNPHSHQPGLAIDALSDQELAVVQLLGKGYLPGDISERLHVSRKTVEAYRRRAAEKLGFDGSAELLQFAIRWANQIA
jgi:DNA-binding NarL/FixJ family response regulator